MSQHWPPSHDGELGPAFAPAPRSLSPASSHPARSEEALLDRPFRERDLDPDTPPPPHSPSADDPLLPPTPTSAGPSARPSTKSISTAFVSSPLNPHHPAGLFGSTNPFAARAAAVSPGAGSSAGSRPVSRSNSMHFQRVPSDEAQALAGGLIHPGSPGSPASSSPNVHRHGIPLPQVGSASTRGSMILYRLATDDAALGELPPPRGGSLNQRDSVFSVSGDSVFSLSSDSKYPTGSTRGLVPYAFDPNALEDDPREDDDELLDYRTPDKSNGGVSVRGALNVTVLVVLILGLLMLFAGYPIIHAIKSRTRLQLIDGNININATGQQPVLFNMPSLIDAKTPQEALTRTGFDGQGYQLVFSDEFETDGRTFYPGDDPYWEAVDLWYWATTDQEWYDPAQITTKDGKLVITMEEVPDPTLNHGMNYKSGMLQTWNKFCFTSGYIEVALSLPGPDENTQGYWPGVWTMGNLGRPGFGATTDGLWPYSYDSCDVGTFPNQTLKDQSGPAAALFSSFSKAKYDMKLSNLPGQRLSACTCPNSEHPGPTTGKGRGAPEIDVLEAEKNKLPGGTGQVVSQSAQFAPFTHDYDMLNATTDEIDIYNPGVTWMNTYKGSAIQQAVSALTQTPSDIFQGSGQNMGVFGFEYWTDPSNPQDGYITWVSGGTQSYRMGAAAVGPDTGPDGSQVGQRLVPEEPMAIILNLGISGNWQTITPSSMTFPGVMLIDYVRVYQREGQMNVGCSPPDYPTEDYINAHMPAYTNPNITGWNGPTGGIGVGANYTWPLNSQYDGC